MKRSAILLLCFSLGCATYSKLMVGPAGDVRNCQASGHGIIGMTLASDSANKCAEGLLAAGYLPIERAGSLGIAFSDSATVLEVKLASPADSAGIVPGDRVVAVNGTRVAKTYDAQRLLFGPIGTKVTVTVAGDSGERTRSVTLASYVAISRAQAK